MARRSKANPALRRNALSSNNNFAPNQSSLAPYARSKSSAPACDARIDETNMLHRWRLLSPMLQSRRTPHDCRRHHSLEKFPGVRGGACSGLKNNPGSATLRPRRITSRFLYPKIRAFSQAVRLCAFLMRMDRRQPACPASSKLAVANRSQRNRSAAPSSPGHAKNPARKPSSRPQPITALLARAFLPFLSSPLRVPQHFPHFPKEYSREVAVLRMAFVTSLPRPGPDAISGCLLSSGPNRSQSLSPVSGPESPRARVVTSSHPVAVPSASRCRIRTMQTLRNCLGQREEVFLGLSLPIAQEV